MCLRDPVVCGIPRRSRERIASGVLAGGFSKSTGGAPKRLFIIHKEQLVEHRHRMPEAFIRPRKYPFWSRT